MNRAMITFLIFSLILLSFKADRKKLLTRTWHAVRLQSPELDSFYHTSKSFIDTLGAGNDDVENLEQFGVTNIDSLRHRLRFQLDSAMTVQMNSVKSTVFTFRTDSVAVLSFDNSIDSCKWYFDKNSRLVLEPLYDTELVKNLNLEVVALSDTALRLKFLEDNAYSIVTFHPQKK